MSHNNRAHTQLAAEGRAIILPLCGIRSADALGSDSPNQQTCSGRRDHALILLAVQTGLRLSELTSLRLDALHVGIGAHGRVIGNPASHGATGGATDDTTSVTVVLTGDPIPSS